MYKSRGTRYWVTASTGTSWHEIKVKARLGKRAGVLRVTVTEETGVKGCSTRWSRVKQTNCEQSHFLQVAAKPRRVSGPGELWVSPEWRYELFQFQFQQGGRQGYKQWSCWAELRLNRFDYCRLENGVRRISVSREEKTGKYEQHYETQTWTVTAYINGG